MEWGRLIGQRYSGDLWGVLDFVRKFCSVGDHCKRGGLPLRLIC